MIEVERGASRLYQGLAHVLGYDARLQPMWRGLAFDELRHVQTLRLLRGVLDLGAAVRPGPVPDRARVERLGAEIARFAARVDREPITTLEAPSMAVTLECSEVDGIFHQLIEAVGPPYVDAPRAMAFRTSGHLQALAAAGDRLGNEEPSQLPRALATEPARA